MQDADTVLSIYQERGKKGLPLDGVYRMLYNRELYLRAYTRLYSNDGAMTKGSTKETVDEMSQAKVDRLIALVRERKFRWTPVRRVHIPKKNGKTRPLGITSWSDKLLQEVIRSLLESYYEPQFNDLSHGFRPGRGCHTALQHLQHTWKGTRWFIEGDIKGYFDNINHDRLMEILKENIKDERFLRLIEELLQAGYLEEWKYNRTLSGTPQGSVLSPLLSNIYLDKFDQYMTAILIPKYTRGEVRKPNPEYTRLTRCIAQLRQQGDKEGVKKLRKQRNQIPSKDPNDPGYRRIRYLRYADDFLIGFDGPKSEAEEMKQLIKEWLKENLQLDLSDEKTLITHAVKGAAQFLGFDIVNQQENTQHTDGKRRINGYMGLRVPSTVVEKQCMRYMQDGRPKHRSELMKNSDYSIVATYQAEYRGIVQYYLPAHNVYSLNRLHGVMRRSLLNTLAAKHRTKATAMRTRYETMITTAEGDTLRCLQVKMEREEKSPLIAQFGGIALKRQPLAILNDQPPKIWNRGTELLERLLADTCELCKSTMDVEVHHIKKLANLKKRRGGRKPSQWMVHMIARQRKTLVVCRLCHEAIHAGTIDERLRELGISWDELRESRVRRKVQARFGEGRMKTG
jgi:group II intron reverse transcriptase/maturase